MGIAPRANASRKIREKVNGDLASSGEKINSGSASDFAFTASLCEAAREPKSLISCDSAGSYIRGVGRLLLAADGRSVALFGAETAQNRARGKSR
ncbi:hypothetical protein, partial [Cloacibacillus porcorum]|uniref:hypothetical protein n=1 Tax=Cloacibacillus porcorum TaxID=1197717 RepID=UPI002353FFDA